MKIYNHPVHSKSGGILVMVMLVMLFVSILAIGLFKLSETDAVETVYVKQSKQAFWLAEAGLQDAIQRLNWVEAYRKNPSSINTNYASGSYTVDISNIEAHPVIEEATNYTIVATGYVQDQNRRVQQVITTIPGLKFAIVGMGGIIEFNSNSKIYGNIIQFQGSIDTGNNSSVVFNDYIFADIVTGDGDYTQAPVPAVNEPTIDIPKYMDQINVVPQNLSAPPLSTGLSSISANTNFDANVTFNNALTVDAGLVIQSTGDMVFRRTPTFNGPVTIMAGGSITFSKKIDPPLPDGSTIIARGDISLSSSTELDTNVKIYSGNNVNIGSRCTIDGGTIIYANEDLTIAAGGMSTISPSSGLGISLLANKNIIINSNMDPFKGIMYSNLGSVTLNANMKVYGTIIGSVGISVDSNIDIFYDSSLFRNWGDAGLGLHFGDVVLTKGIWQELDPL